MVGVDIDGVSVIPVITCLAAVIVLVPVSYGRGYGRGYGLGCGVWTRGCGGGSSGGS